MQVFGLPRHVIRAGCVASRIAAKPSSSEAAIREATLARWMKLRSYGLTAGQAAAGIDQSRSTLYRWAKAREPKSRRPHLSRRKPYFSGRVSEVVLQGFLRPAAAAKADLRVERLASREREIVQLLAEGNTNKDIARRLGLSVKTVETHRAVVLRKLGLSSLVGLVRWAIRNNLVQA